LTLSALALARHCQRAETSQHRAKQKSSNKQPRRPAAAADPASAEAIIVESIIVFILPIGFSLW
jgi:hypothetical protein